MSDLDSRTSPTLSNILDNITNQIDLDLATTIADALNVYMNAIRRNGNRTILGPPDAVRILHIIHQIKQGCDHAPDPEVIPGAPYRRPPPPSNTP